MKKRFLGVVFTIMVFSLLLTCNIEQSEKKGSLILNFPMIQSRTLLPAISMDPVSYDINGTGPDGATFSSTSDQSTIKVTKIDFGNWSVRADAKNADGTIIGHGETTCRVHVGETTEVDIIVTPLNGTGTIDLTVNWAADDTEYPSIESEIIPATGNPVDLDFTITGGNLGNVKNNSIPTGFHTLIVKLMDGNADNISPVLTMGAVEVVRIVKNETTFGTFNFTRINKLNGNIQVNIAPEMDDPLAVTLSGQQAQIEEGSLMTVTASVAPEVGNVTCVWYLNAESPATGDSYTVSGLSLGVYRLDVTVFTTDGKRAGSATCSFTVVEPEPTQKITFEKFYGDRTGGSYIYTIQQTDDNGYIMGGCHDNWHGWLIKIDKFGNEQWSKIFDNLTSIKKIIYLGEEGFLFITDNGLMVRTDKFGNELWSSKYAAIRDICKTLDNNYILCGTSSGGGDAWLAKIDNTGNVIWIKNYLLPGYDVLNAVYATSDNGYIAVGTTEIMDSNYYDGWIIKTDSEGNELWSHVLGTIGPPDSMEAVIQLTDGSIVVAGTTVQENVSNYYYSDGWIIKLDLSGQILWTKYYGGNGREEISSINTTDSGEIIIAGDSSGDGWILKIDTDGKYRWSHTFGGYWAAKFYSGLQTNDGGFIFGGDYRYERNSHDGWIIKTDESGNL